VVKRRNNSSEIHLLRIDNEVIEDSKLIKDHILDFYKNIFVGSISNVQDTNNTIWKILLVLIFLSWFPLRRI